MVEGFGGVMTRSPRPKQTTSVLLSRGPSRSNPTRPTVEAYNAPANAATNKIIENLDLEEIELNHYLVTSPNEGWQRGTGPSHRQALVAASRTVSQTVAPTACTAIFCAPATPTFRFTKLTASATVRVSRGGLLHPWGQAIFTMSILRSMKAGLIISLAPDVPDPETANGR